MANNSSATAPPAEARGNVAGVPPVEFTEQEGIAKAFASLLEEYQQGKSKIATKEEEARKKQNQELLAKTSGYTVDRIVNDKAQDRGTVKRSPSTSQDKSKLATVDPTNTDILNSIESLQQIKAGFGSAVSQLSEHLTTKATQLEQITRAIAT